MSENAKRRRQGWIFALVAILVALALIGLWSDGFGLYGNEMAPGTTTPPDNPT